MAVLSFGKPLISQQLAAQTATGSTPGIAMTIKTQWINPVDIFSLMMILGADIIQCAMAQQVGNGWAPIAFSFGHVAYGINALLAAFGDGRLMPSADYEVTLIGAKSGHERNNKAWIIGRLLRDHESFEAKSLADTDGTSRHEALRISVFRPSHQSFLPAGVPSRDITWWSGLAAIALQMIIGSIPCIVHRNFFVLLITASGCVLSVLQTTNPQWTREKWACPTSGSSTVSLTQGNGSRHVMVVLGKEHLPGQQHGLDLEILAAKSHRFYATTYSRCFISLMALFWVAFLVTAIGIQVDTWYLIIVGTIGMVHNLFVTATPRASSCLGIHLTQLTTITEMKVSLALKKTEELYPMVGSSLIPTFFPGGLLIPDSDIEFWTAASKKRGLSNLADIGIRVNIG